MEIKKIAVTIKDLCKGYVNDSEIQIKLNVVGISLSPLTSHFIEFP